MDNMCIEKITKVKENEEKIIVHQQGQIWSQEQLNIFFDLYLQHGPSWSYISSLIKTKSPVTIKNKFYNSLRSCANILAQFEVDVLLKLRKSINKDVLLTVLEVVNKLQKAVYDMKLTINWQCKLFTFKYQITKFCLSSQQFSPQKIKELIKLISAINCKLRTFSIFKAKKLGNWKLTQKVLNFTWGFDKFVRQDVDKFVYNKESQSFGIKCCDQNIVKIQQTQPYWVWNTNLFCMGHYVYPYFMMDKQNQI